MARLSLALIAAFAFMGCRSEQALLHDTAPDAPVAEYTIQIPDGYTVRSVGFGAAYATSVSGGGSWCSR